MVGPFRNCRNCSSNKLFMSGSLPEVNLCSTHCWQKPTGPVVSQVAPWGVHGGFMEKQPEPRCKRLKSWNVRTRAWNKTWSCSDPASHWALKFLPFECRKWTIMLMIAQGTLWYTIHLYHRCFSHWYIYIYVVIWIHVAPSSNHSYLSNALVRKTDMLDVCRHPLAQGATRRGGWAVCPWSHSLARWSLEVQ